MADITITSMRGTKHYTTREWIQHGLDGQMERHGVKPGDPVAFIVMGHTGEYADETSWPVAVYGIPEAAVRHAVLADEAATKLDARTPGAGTDEHTEFDPHGRIDYTGAWYTVVLVDASLRVEGGCAAHIEAAQAGAPWWPKS